MTRNVSDFFANRTVRRLGRRLVTAWMIGSLIVASTLLLVYFLVARIDLYQTTPATPRVAYLLFEIETFDGSIRQLYWNQANPQLAPLSPKLMSKLNGVRFDLPGIWHWAKIFVF